MILEPFSDDEKLTKKEREEPSKKQQDVVHELDKLSKDSNMSLTFEEFLKHVEWQILIPARFLNFSGRILISALPEIR